MTKKVVILGPESTGKSSLCERLAKHYNTNWVPEYAREYLLKHGTDYHFEDLLDIAKGQLTLEDSISAPRSTLCFIDTDMYVMKVWCEFVFQKCHRFILDSIIERHYDLYLLCNTDLPWVKDELREYPNQRERDILFNMYKDCMINQSTPWVIIEGGHETRLAKAIESIDTVLS